MESQTRHIAERVNGIIKAEVIYKEKRFKTIGQAGFRLERYINFYNEQRPHSSIDMKVPSQAHEEYGFQNRRWKKVKCYPKAHETKTLLSTDSV